MSILITPTSFTIRGYEGDVVRYGEPYKFVCTVQVFEETAFISGFHGTINLDDRRRIGKGLKELGIKKAVWTHNSKATSINK